MYDSATDETVKEELKAEIDLVNQDIRWIQQSIGDNKNALNQAQNNLAKMAWDASIRSEQ